MKKFLLYPVLFFPALLLAQPRQALPDDQLKGAAAVAALKEVDALRAQLLEERRQALLRAAAAKTPEEKVRIRREVVTAQQERLKRVREKELRVREERRSEQEAVKAARKSDHQ